jgi:3-deoxy-7-phosphoheptulonate synthase
MFIVMRKDSSEKELQEVLERVSKAGFSGHVSRGMDRTVVGILGQTYPELREVFEVLPYVEEVIPITKPYKLSSREFQPQNTIVRVGDINIGGDEVVLIAGPCAVETREQVLETAQAVKAAGADILRGGAFKPSTSPYHFRGLGPGGLEFLAYAGRETGLPIVTEVMSPQDVGLVSQYADILQVGTRNMQNFALLDKVGQSQKPVLLKRGLSATIEEWLLSAEYILSQGNQQLILCERGIRTFETYTRNTMDISSIPVIKRLSHLPIIADPSHGTGRWYLVTPLALAALAAGADGIMIEVHPHPEKALKDGPQSLTFENFEFLMSQAASVATSVGRKLRSRAKP